MEFVAIPIIVVICSIFMSIVKLFTNGNAREEEILATTVPVFGALLGLTFYFINHSYFIQFDDPIIDMTIGFISGQSALETKSTFDYLKSKKVIEEMVATELSTTNVQEIIKEQVDNELKTDETQEIIKEQVDNIIQ